MKEVTFGKYRLLAELGQGGMADVILALSQGPVGFNKLVVLKRLRHHLAEDPEFVAMLVDEARLAARLNHPNIVHTHEVGEIDGLFFMAMEYLEGQPLTRFKRRTRRRNEELSLEAEVRVLADVLAGLHYAHELTDFDGASLGIVHRDVTPSNIFITFDGVVKIVDFGIAKATGRTTETRTGVVKGKTTYMPPEQAMGLDVDRRADVFAVGVMLWEAATGQRMWKGLADVVILARLINGEIPSSPREVNPDVPEAMDAICRKALCAEPSDRFATALEFQNELESFLQSSPKRAGNRDLGRLVTRLFEEERLEIKRVIEEQLTKLKDAPNSSLTPLILPDTLSSSAIHEIPQGALVTSGSPHESSGEEADAALYTVPTNPPKGRARSMMGALAAVLAVGAAIWLFAPSSPTASQGAPASEAESPTPPVGVSATASNRAPTAGRLALRAVPSSARFSVDGGPWLDNPYAGEIKLDASEHTIVVRARGYVDKNYTTKFDKDVVLEATLKKKPRAAASRPVPRTAPHPAPVQPKKPPRELITGDPWQDG